MNYNPSEDYDDTSNGETDETDKTATKQDNAAATDKNEPDELSQPGVGVQYEDEPVGDSD
jgi:hypothetical protein